MKDMKNVKTKKWDLKDDFRRRWQLYLMLLLPVLYIIIFCYLPMGGIVIAFKNFSFRNGFFGGEFVGLKHFKRFLTSPDFWLVLKNTLVLSLYSLLAGFPVPIILALSLHLIKADRFKKVVQTVTYMPYFISMVVMVGILFRIFDYHSGLLNNILQLLGFGKSDILGNGKMFRHVYVWSGVWQTAGYSAILYIATLGNVDQSLIDASLIDGASLWQRLKVVELQVLRPIIVIQLIMAVGGIMGGSFDKVFLLQNPVNLEYSETIATFVYKRGLQNVQFSFASAVGLFNAVVNFVLLFTANQMSKRFGESSLF